MWKRSTETFCFSLIFYFEWNILITVNVCYVKWTCILHSFWRRNAKIKFRRSHQRRYFWNNNHVSYHVYLELALVLYILKREILFISHTYYLSLFRNIQTEIFCIQKMRYCIIYFRTKFFIIASINTIIITVMIVSVIQTRHCFSLEFIF